MAKRFDRRVAFSAAAVLLVALFVPLVRSSISQAQEISGPYTSTLARQWMTDHLKGSRVLVEVYAPRLPASDFKVFVVDETGELSEAEILGRNAEPGWEIGRVKELADVSARNIEYVVMTGYYQHFLDEKERYPNEVKNYERIMSQGKLVYDVQSIPGVSRGPRVRIFQLSQTSDLVLQK